MSIESTIKDLEALADGCDAGMSDPRRQSSILRAAIEKLETHQDNQPNEPLTLKEMEDALDRMDGGLAVWVDDFASQGPMVAGIVDYDTEIVVVTGYKGPYFRGKDYGKTWTAYLRRPEVV